MGYFVVAVILACCSWAVAGQKNRDRLWWFVLTLICPLLFLLVLCLPKVVYSQPVAKKKCPHCAEDILADAKVCKHCGRDN